MLNESNEVCNEDCTMKNTGKLAVIGDYTMKEGIVNIHPNDGFDIGLMTTNYPAYIYADVPLADFQAGNGDRINGTICLKNECKMGTVEINLRFWERMGKPKEVQLYYDDSKLLFAVPEST